ncbi:tyrosine decarboxylase-like isoform X2 [Coccinella septempunctata]|nr:tyrosine decarboxylase-like isoform X2 [Coccinella septempunctata]
MVDYICSYLINVEKKRVTPNVEPGYLRNLLPEEAPQEPEDWEAIMSDLDDKIMPGITHWQHPRFHAYFPSGNSFPSILADMLSDAIGCIGFSWAASPSCTELETIVVDWLARAMGLPNHFITSHRGSTGGGVIQGSASECILVSMLAARNQAIKHLKNMNPDIEDSAFLPKLVGYCSRESHSCVEKAAKILLVKLRILDPDEKGALRGGSLKEAMEKDAARGLLPFFVSTTLGTTSCCSFDNLPEIGPICKDTPCTWLHVDGAYGGNALILPELKYLLNGLEYADSFNINPNKWLLVNFDCSCLWVKSRERLTHALVVDPLYLQHANADEAIDYRHWGISLSRRFRALKLWFVIRKYGLSGLQSYMRNHIRLAKNFESLILRDNRFEAMNEVKLGLVCFRLKASDIVNQNLLAIINAAGKLHMIPSMVKGKYVIRFCVTHEHAKDDDIDIAWSIIDKHASRLINVGKEIFIRPPLTRQKSKRFSFTRSVSKELYKRSISKSNLHDGATPILVADSDDESEECSRDILNELVITSTNLDEDDEVFIEEE